MDKHLKTITLRDLEEPVKASKLSEEIGSDTLTEYLKQRRWFGLKDADTGSAIIDTMLDLPLREIKLAVVNVTANAQINKFLIPLQIVWDDDPDDAGRDMALSKAYHAGRTGLLTDAFSRPEFARAIMRSLTDPPASTGSQGLEYVVTQELGGDREYDHLPIRWLSGEQSNSSLIVDNLLMIKLIRHIFAGVHPEVEITRHLTLCGYQNTAQLLAEVAIVEPDGSRSTCIVVQRALANHGDAWAWMGERLQEIVTASTEEDSETSEERMALLMRACRKIGQRLAELHLTLAKPTDNENFMPVPTSPEDSRTICQHVQQQINEALQSIQEHLGVLKERTAQEAQHLIANQTQIMRDVEQLAAATIGTMMTRTHGDFHLGQILLSQDDAYIIDFEGEPAKDLAARRAKTHPLRDVAGLLRSFDYLAASIERETDRKLSVADFTSRFATRAKTTFLDGYLSAYRAAAPTTTHMISAQVLKLFLLEKAAYEICYEASNRPEWLPIAIAGFAATTQQPPTPSPT